MKINHLGITVSDVQAASNFLNHYFGLNSVGAATPGMAHLQDDDGFILSLFRGSEPTSPQTTHLGFIQATEAQVDRLYRRFKEDGFEVAAPRRSHGYTFYIVAPGGFAVEVVC